MNGNTKQHFCIPNMIMLMMKVGWGGDGGWGHCVGLKVSTYKVYIANHGWSWMCSKHATSTWKNHGIMGSHILHSLLELNG